MCLITMTLLYFTLLLGFVKNPAWDTKLFGFSSLEWCSSLVSRIVLSKRRILVKLAWEGSRGADGDKF